MINITPEIKQELSRFKTSEELLRSGGISIPALDRAAFGFSDEDIKTLMPSQLNIKWKNDLANVLYEIQKSGLSKKQWAVRVDLSQPIEVAFEKNRFYIEDGHHRYYAAKILNKPLNVDLTIEMNPIKALAPKLGYDEFHRQVFDEVMSGENKINEIISDEIQGAKIYYHGRNSNRPYRGNYIYLTDNLGYASGYSNGKLIQKYTMPFSTDKIFSILNPKHLLRLRKYMDDQSISAIIRDSGRGQEMDWAALNYLGTDDYELPEDLLQHMGFYGVKLKERQGIESIYVFNQNQVKYIGDVDMSNPDIIKQINVFNDDFVSNNGVGYDVSEQLQPQQSLKVYHGTNTGKVGLIKSNGLISPLGYDNPEWFMVSTDFESALFHATPVNEGSVFVFEFTVPVEKHSKRWFGFPYFWKGYERTASSTWYALKEPLPRTLITRVHEISYVDWIDRKRKKY